MIGLAFPIVICLVNDGSYVHNYFVAKRKQIVCGVSQDSVLGDLYYEILFLMEFSRFTLVVTLVLYVMPMKLSRW